MFYWNPWGALSVAVSILVWIMAGFVFWARPDRSQNRRLAAMLLAEGFILFGGAGLIYVTTDEAIGYASQMVNFTAWLMILVAYPLFIATLDTPLAKPFRHWWGHVPGAAVGLFAFWLVLFQPEWLVTGMHSTWYTQQEAVINPSARFTNMVSIVLFIYGLAATVSAWRRTLPGSLRRRQNRDYALAFIWRDLVIISLVIASMMSLNGESRVRDSYVIIMFPIMTLGFVILLANGILRSQLFGIDLKLKWAINKGTLASIFLGIFFVVGLATSEFLLDRFGYVVGAVVAGGLMLVVKPLQKAGERVANAAMPNVEDTPAYHERRRKEIYGAAFESALQDGKVTDRERDVLATLQEELGLRPTEARAIEKAIA